MSHVLVVDDSAIDRDIVSLTLTHHGYDVSEASTGREGLDAVRRRPPHLVVSDLLMPDMDGYEFAFALRNDLGLSDLPILFFSASYNAREFGDLEEVYLGCSFLGKPAGPQEILEAVETALRAPARPKRLSADASDFMIDRGRLLSAKLMNTAERLERQRVALAARSAQMEAVAAFARAALAGANADTLYESAVTTAARVLSADVATALEFRPGGDSLRLRAGVGVAADELGTVVHADPASLAAHVRAAEGPVAAGDIVHAAFQLPAFLLAHDVVGTLNVPVGLHPSPFGILGVHSRTARSFTDDETRFLTSIADSLAQALATRRAEADRSALEHQVAEAQKLEALGRLAGGVAHDFNNILTGIRLHCSALLRRTTDETARDSVVEIDRAAERAADLTRQLVVVGRGQVLRPEVTDLNHAVETTMALLGRVLGEDIETHTELGGEIDAVVVDRAQLTQVILNLAVNAREAMADGGRLTIRTSNLDVDALEALPTLAPGRYVCLEVEDTGDGMDAETLAHAYEPFFTTKSEGTGLGLATVRGIVEQSGGAIALRTTPGVGTVFTIVLPGADDSYEQIAPAAPLTSTGHECILLVEDESVVRSAAAAELAEYGYTVLTAAGGQEALDLVARESTSVDLLVTDVVMPGMNGRELADALAARGDAELKVLFTSGYPADDILRRGISAGRVGFLQKPYMPDELARAVRAALDAA